MELIHQKFATFKWAELMAPAISQAEAGLPVSKNLTGIISDEMNRLEKYSPSRDWFHSIYFKDGLPLQPGDVLKNAELPASLKKVAAGGADVFYKGEIADKLAAYYEKYADGWITKADLAAYQVKVRAPVTTTYRGYSLVTVPPPSSGGLTLANILNIMEKYDVAKLGRTSTAFHHTFLEAQKLAYADRGRYMADSDFVNVPMAGLVSKQYAAERAALIAPDAANNGVKPGDPGKYSAGSTTSFSVIDKDGNMITITQTINNFLGACVVPEGTGILMNDEMDDFACSNPASVNAPDAGKRPLSSMSPTIVLKDGKPFMTLGTPGGPRIITTIAQIIMNVVDFRMDLQAAINDPRMFNPNAAVAQLERPVDEATVNELQGWGHKVNLRPELSLYFGGAQGIMILPDGRLHGAADLRRLGQAFGY